MRFTDFLLEQVEGEVIPPRTGAAAKLASELLQSSDGDVRAAKQLATSFHERVLDEIYKQGRFTETERIGGGFARMSGRPPPRTVPGYEETPPPPSRFNEYA